jgi:hypothetical protein
MGTGSFLGVKRPGPGRKFRQFLTQLCDPTSVTIASYAKGVKLILHLSDFLKPIDKTQDRIGLWLEFLSDEYNMLWRRTPVQTSSCSSIWTTIFPSALLIFMDERSPIHYWCPFRTPDFCLQVMHLHLFTAPSITSPPPPDSKLFIYSLKLCK